MALAQPSGTCCSGVRFFCLLFAFSRILLLSCRVPMRLGFALRCLSKFSPWDTLPTNAVHSNLISGLQVQCPSSGNSCRTELEAKTKHTPPYGKASDTRMRAHTHTHTQQHMRLYLRLIYRMACWNTCLMLFRLLAGLWIPLTDFCPVSCNSRQSTSRFQVLRRASEVVTHPISRVLFPLLVFQLLQDWCCSHCFISVKEKNIFDSSPALLQSKDTHRPPTHTRTHKHTRTHPSPIPYHTYPLAAFRSSLGHRWHRLHPFLEERWHTQEFVCVCVCFRHLFGLIHLCWTPLGSSLSARAWLCLFFKHVCSVLSLFRETRNNLVPAHVLNPSLCQEKKMNSNAVRATPQSRYLETDLSWVNFHITFSLDKGIFFVIEGFLNWSTTGNY